MNKHWMVALTGAALVWALGFGDSTSEADSPEKTCATEYPKHLTSVPSSYIYDSEDEAFRVLVNENKNFSLRKEGNRDRATSGPCEGIGWHTKVKASYKKNGREAGYPGSLVGCPICKDTSSGPELYEKWAIR